MSLLIVGLGNPMRSDDAAGLLVAERLGPPGAVAVLGDPLGAVEMWDNGQHVVIVDAMRSGAAPGTIRRVAAADCGRSDTRYASSHASGPAELIGLAAALGRLPARCEVVGIEAGCVDLGAPMSPEVLAAVDRLVAELSRELVDA